MMNIIQNEYHFFHSYPTHLQALNEERNVEKNGEKRDGYDVERDVSEVGRRPE